MKMFQIYEKNIRKVTGVTRIFKTLNHRLCINLDFLYIRILDLKTDSRSDGECNLPSTGLDGVLTKVYVYT